MGRECPDSDNFAPALPSSLNMTFKGSPNPYDESHYVFPHLALSDIQCQDVFWSEACTMDYCQDQAVATEKAGLYMSIPYFFTVALTFHLGLFVDATGYRTEMICAGSALLVAAHSLLAYHLSPPSVPLVIQGIGYTMCVAALWPSVPYTVSENSVGMAFGIMMAVQNIGLGLIPIAVAHLYGANGNHYLPTVELFFVVCSILALVVGVALMISDKKTDHILGTPRSNIRFNPEKGAVVVKRARDNSDAMILY